jgi:hypothetical protein
VMVIVAGLEFDRGGASRGGLATVSKASSLPWSLENLRLPGWRRRGVPEGRLESRPAIYRRYWCLEFDLVPEGRLKSGLALG